MMGRPHARLWGWKIADSLPADQRRKTKDEHYLFVLGPSSLVGLQSLLSTQLVSRDQADPYGI